MIKVLEDKEKNTKDMTRYARNNGPVLDMKVKKLYTHWKAYLEPFIDYLNNDITKLKKIPLGSSFESTNEKLNSI